MANSKGSSNIRNFMYSGKHALLPPKSPFPSVSSSYVDYVPSGLIGSKSVSKPKESNTHHLRTSSETFLIEEQPSWLDDLLNEPETPVRRGGHRRSSSDSFAYVDVGNISNIDYAAQDEYRYKNTIPLSPWGSQDFDFNKDARQTSLYADVNVVKQKNRTWDSNLRSAPNSGGFPSARENIVSTGSLCATQVVDGVLSSTNEKHDAVDSTQHDPKSSSEKKDGSHAKSSASASASASDNESKRAKQQFAQRSRVRKLQYIAELERNVQALQAEGSEVSAELEFLNQQHLILSMENKALKHRLESLAQEQLLKYVEHEVLEKEIGRLRALYQQQNQPQQMQSQQKQHQPSSHRRTNSRDLESQFGTLSLKNKDTNSGRESVTGSLRI